MKKKSYGLIAIIMCTLVAIGNLFPLIWLVDVSLLKSNELFSKHFLVWPETPQFGNYVLAWVNGKIPNYLVNSVFISVISVGLIVLLSFMMSYSFTKMRWKLSKLFLNVVLLGIMIPIHATLLPNFLTFSDLGLTDTPWGLIIPYVAFGLSQATFLMTGFMYSIPESIEESALLEGCGIYRMLFTIIMPMVKPAIVTVIITSFIGIWNEFIMAATFLSSEKFKTLPFSIQNFEGLYAANYSAQFAVMVLTALPSLLIYIILNKHITKGIIAGATKG